MKETPIFEEVCYRLLKLPSFWSNFLIGGLLSFVPIVNLLAFGYLFRVSRAVRKTGAPQMPNWPNWPSLQHWQDWQGLFKDGLRFAVVWFGYWLLPLLVAACVSWLMALIGLGALSNVLLLSVVLLATVLFSSALYRYNMRKDFKDLLDVALILRMSWMELPRLIVPALVFLGLLVLLLPFYGFALFGGFLMFITYTSLRYRRFEHNKSSTF
ncbi:DUF4013 domain-containing protein [Coraliomargarita sp. SDUM461004]|uniref:DUF4013 domain-containing protein n=1 Tax=Thalassobacterium sedimentorum TaxID=3041258 RepID=A0ABU1ALQ1_9BACT|nr:DUF4013 domain-containing protein [Coraliomargarita sp. SDUM461004]MDQ8195735.1 DUF4013 domain-containing protein [Coraliomargarita sp. SDUM461004]